jgi:hypothetical protein
MARRLLDRIDETVLSEDEISDEGEPRETTPPPIRKKCCICERSSLAAVVDGTEVDPKVQVILHFLRERRWLEDNGAIIFSQSDYRGMGAGSALRRIP